MRRLSIVLLALFVFGSPRLGLVAARARHFDAGRLFRLFRQMRLLFSGLARVWWLMRLLIRMLQRIAVRFI